jgi:protein TonB
LSLTFFSAPPPPPPPPPPAKHHSETKHIEKPTQPTVIPQLVQPKEEPKEEDSGEDDGVEGGVEGGVKGGTVGGTVGGVIGGVVGGTQGPPAKPKNVPYAKIANELLVKPDPHLPNIVLIQRKGTGDAIFMAKVCVDTGGNVNQVTVMQGIPGADGDIIATLKQWKWKKQEIPICFVNRWVFSIN